MTARLSSPGAAGKSRGSAPAFVWTAVSAACFNSWLSGCFAERQACPKDWPAAAACFNRWLGGCSPPQAGSARGSGWLFEAKTGVQRGDLAGFLQRSALAAEQGGPCGRFKAKIFHFGKICRAAAGFFGGNKEN